MNKLKRVLSGTLALAMAASMLTACGGDDSSSSSAAANSGNDSTGSSTTDNSGAPSGEKVTIKVYTFTNETQGMLDRYKEKNPDVNVEFDVTLEADASTYIQKVGSALNGDEAPDLFLADADYAQLFAGYEGTATLAELGVEFDENDYYSYMLDFTTVDGNRMAISHQATPGAILYRTDYAEQYLGVKTPEEMQAKLGTWDDFKKVADTLKENDIYMVSGIDELKRCFMANRDAAWVDADLNYHLDEDLVKEYLEVTKYLCDNEQTNYADNTQWKPEWNEGMVDGVFCYFGCTWYLHYTIKPNCLKTKTGAADEEGNPTVADSDYVVGNGSFGKWGMVQGPMAYFWGGTWWYGSDKCAADEAKKAIVADVIEFYTCDAEAMTDYAKTSGDFVSKISVVDAIKDDEAFNNPFLGGQNHYQYFAEAAKNVNAKTMSKYDDTFNTAVNNATLAYVLNGASMEDALAMIKEEASTSIEGLK